MIAGGARRRNSRNQVSRFCLSAEELHKISAITNSCLRLPRSKLPARATEARYKRLAIRVLLGRCASEIIRLGRGRPPVGIPLYIKAGPRWRPSPRQSSRRGEFSIREEKLYPRTNESAHFRMVQRCCYGQYGLPFQIERGTRVASRLTFQRFPNS